MTKYIASCLNSLSPLGYRLVKGSFWALLGSVASRAMMLVASIVIARVLGKEEFGELGAIQSTVGMLGIFAGLGLGLTATKYVAEFRQKDPAKAGRIIALSFVVTLVTGSFLTILLYLLAPWLAAATLAAPHLYPLLRIGTLLLLFGAINGAQVGALSGLEAFRPLAGINMFSGIASFPIMLACVYFGGLSGVVWGYVVSAMISCLGSHYMLRVETRSKNIAIHFAGCFKEWRILYSFSLPAVLSQIMVGPVNWLCAVMLINQPNGYAELGIFNAANQWYNALMFLPGIIGQVAMPILSEQIGIQELRSSKRVLKYSIMANAACVLPIVAISCFASSFVMGLYGRDFDGSGGILIVVLLTAALVSVQNPVGNIIAAADKMWIGFLTNFGWGIVIILLTYLFLTQGALGFAYARLGAYIVHGIWVFFYVYRLIKEYEELYG